MICAQDDNRPHIAVIGAGIAGCTLAYELSKGPCRVTLLGSGRIGEQGASAVPLALINPHRGRSARASALDQAGLAAMRDLASELQALGLDHGMNFPGVLRIPSSSRQARQWQKLGLAFIAPGSVPNPYHAPFGALLVGEGGYLEPKRLLKALCQAAQQRGASILERYQVTDIAGSSIRGTGERLEADVIVLCVGASQGDGLPLPELERLAGDMLHFESALTLAYPVAGAVYGGQLASGLYIGGNHRSSEQAQPEELAGLQKAASWFIPELATATLTSVWTGVRARSADNQPRYQQLTDKLWFFGALGGRGFLCARYLAQQFAAQLNQKVC